MKGAGVGNSAGCLTRSRRVIGSCLAWYCCDGCSFSFFLLPLERSLHAPFIVSRRCRVIKCWRVVWPLLEEPRGLGGPYLVATWPILWRHGVGTFGTACYVSGMGTTIGGVVFVLRCCSDVPCHTWSYSRHGMFILVV
jgi:hypothetical protein